MRLLKAINGEVIKYPYTTNDLRLDYPHVSFPADMTGENMESFNCYVVESTIPPTYSRFAKIRELSPTLENGVWKQTWESTPIPDEDLIHVRNELKTAITKHRYQVESGGIVVGGNRFATDRESQIKYVAVAFELSYSDPQTYSITWKTEDAQFVVLNLAEMVAVVGAVRTHVQACFNKEAEYHALVDSATRSELEVFDFSAGWPPND